MCQPCQVCQLLWICVVHPGPLLIPSETQRHLHLKRNTNKQHVLLLLIVFITKTYCHLSPKQDNNSDGFQLNYHPQKRKKNHRTKVFCFCCEYSGDPSFWAGRAGRDPPVLSPTCLAKKLPILQVILALIRVTMSMKLMKRHTNMALELQMQVFQPSSSFLCRRGSPQKPGA